MFSSRGFRVFSRLFSVARKTRAANSSSKQLRYNWLALGVGASAFSAYTFADEEPARDILVCKLEELIEGSPRKVQIGENPQNFIVVAKVDGKVYAVGGKCSHYGAPMNAGYLDGTLLYCPWHSAAFDIRTGEIAIAPFGNNLPSYKCRVAENGDVLVSIPDSKIDKVTATGPSPRLVKPDGTDSRTFVIIGGGAAGNACAETLRKEGFKGRIVILSKDAHVTYDRPPLSKNFKMDPTQLLLRPQDFYEEFGIEFKTNAEVTQVDTAHKQVKLATGETLSYDKLCVATGAVARVPNAYKNLVKSVKGVFTLRTAEDYNKLKEHVAQAKNVVVIGGSFLGTEIAYGTKSGFPEKHVTVVDPSEEPLAKAFGTEIARQVYSLQRKNGVKVELGKRIKSINQVDGVVKSVTIVHKDEFKGDYEETIDADLVVISTGAEIQTALLPPHLLNSDGSVRVNLHLQTEAPDVYAAGDIASFLSTITESKERIEHWAVAQDQGVHAALNMLGKGKLYVGVPFFWSTQYGRASFVGYASNSDWTFTETEDERDPETTARITYFFKGARCTGAAVINKPGAVIRLRIALERGLMPSREELVSGKVRFSQIAQRVVDSNPTRRPCCGGNKKP
jgi:NADPH-dependent 2,4-dienoyl-CoA reductase/sulfur reductase-like enzyme/nitrite reductase/ring-hydroxylating ferredoxin subunit